MAKRASARGIRRDISGILRAPRRMKVADAVRDFMRVPIGAGNSVKWDPNLAPYIIEPMNSLASREYDAVVFVGPARTGKTIGLIDGWIVYNIVCDPADMLVIQVSEEKAREHSKKRLDRTFRCSPDVKSRLSPRRNDNNVHDRTFRAGNYLKIGWPSVNIMSSSDYKSVALTDYDRFPEDTFPDNTDRSTRRAKAAGDVPLYLLQTDALKDQVNNALWRDSPGPNYVHFPDWLGSWFYDELTYEERSTDGKWSKPGRGANEAFDLLVYADALAILHGYEKIKWPAAPEWARRETWLENAPPEAGEAASQTPEPVPTKKRKRKKPVTDDSNPWSTSGGWL